MTFIDNYLKKLWTYFMQYKTNTFQKFRQFKAEIKNSSRQNICTLCTNNGGEYLSKSFTSFLLAAGITRELTQSYTPHSNGVAERRNWSLQDIVWFLLLDRKLPPHFRSEAVRAATLILNLRPFKTSPDKSPRRSSQELNPPWLISAFSDPLRQIFWVCRKADITVRLHLQHLMESRSSLRHT